VSQIAAMLTAWIRGMPVERWRLRLRSLLFSPAMMTAAIIILVAALDATNNPLLDLVELNWLDLRFQLRGPLVPTGAVVVAAIDEKSLETEGHWPWRRTRIAALVDALSRDGAKVIGFDVTFPEPDDNARLALVDQLAGKVQSLAINSPPLAEFIRESRSDADTDQALASALKRSSAAIVLGYFFYTSEAKVGYALKQETIDQRLDRIAASKYPVVFFRDQKTVSLPAIKAYAAQTSLAMFTAAATSSGHFTVVSDADGAVRWVPLVIQGGDEFFPPLSILCAWHYLGQPLLAIRAGQDGVEGVQLGDRFLPTDEKGQLLINYRGGPQTFPYYSASDILGGKLPGGTFKDKIVLVGATAIGIGDLRTTPFGKVFPGPEVHATVIDNILAGDFAARPRWYRAIDLLVIVVLGALTGAALPRMSALGGFVFAASLVAVYMLAAYGLFAIARLWLNMVYPLTTVAMCYTVLTVDRYLTEERERKRIKETFKHYVSADVIEDVLADPEHLKLGGQEKVLSVMFSDLVGFTSYSEKYPASEIIGILSDYYDRMTEQVFAHRGTLTNYNGDELMAIFGAPVEQADHAHRACATAVAMLEQRDALAAEWAKLGRPHLRARTGINTGSMLVGNVGSRYRFAYTVLGDSVNLASRLEQLNRVYGTQIMIGEHTADLVATAFLLRQIDRVRVKGRQQALHIYELIGTIAAPLPTARRQMFDRYAAAMIAYRERRWAEAAALFEQSLALWPEDGPSRVMVDRCRIYRGMSPPGDWDGAFEHLTKG
jgi:adenylate cyclase